MSHYLRQSLGILLLAASAPFTAYAVDINIPSSAQPARAEGKWRVEEERPQVGGQPILSMPDQSGAQKPLQSDTRFTLKGIELVDAVAVSREELSSAYNDHMNQEVTFTSLNQITSRITAIYRNKGYILSRAVLPPQRIKDGMVKIQIIEGFVNKVVFEGKSADSKLLASYGEKIKSSRPLNASALERYLLLIEDLPGVRAQAVLRPSADTPGSSDVVVTLIEKQFDGSVTADNRGSRYIGPLQFGFTANANNMLGEFDRTQLRGLVTSQTEEERFVQILHEEQVGSEGTEVFLSAGHARTKPGYRVEQFDIEGVDTVFSAGVSHPFIRSRQSNLFGNAQFDVRNTDTDAIGFPLNADRLRVLRLGGSYDFVDALQAINRVDAQFSKGFSWDDDANPYIRSRINGRTNFYKGTAQGSRLQSVYGPVSLYLAAKGQMASAALLSAEQFGLGGADFGSAYDPSEITGDSGLATRAELQYSGSGSGDFNAITAYQFYGFYDYGKAWIRNPSAGLQRADSLSSAGLGVRFNVDEPLSGNLEWAMPLTRDVAASNFAGKGNVPRVFFSLAYRY